MRVGACRRNQYHRHRHRHCCRVRRCRCHYRPSLHATVLRFARAPTCIARRQRYSRRPSSSRYSKQTAEATRVGADLVADRPLRALSRDASQCKTPRERVARRHRGQQAPRCGLFPRQEAVTARQGSRQLAQSRNWHPAVRGRWRGGCCGTSRHCQVLLAITKEDSI